MDSWKKLDEPSPRQIEDLYSSQNIEDIIDVCYEHEKKCGKTLQ